MGEQNGSNLNFLGFHSGTTHTLPKHSYLAKGGQGLLLFLQPKTHQPEVLRGARSPGTCQAMKLGLDSCEVVSLLM